MDRRHFGVDWPLGAHDLRFWVFFVQCLQWWKFKENICLIRSLSWIFWGLFWNFSVLRHWESHVYWVFVRSSNVWFIKSAIYFQSRFRISLNSNIYVILFYFLTSNIKRFVRIWWYLLPQVKICPTFHYYW